VILLARHGETDDNIPPERVMGSIDPPLNARGREQAQELARAVAGDGLAAVWSSHLRRARETAEIVADALGLTVHVDSRLAESRRGRWEGRLIADIQREDPAEWRAWMRAGADFRFPGGGESLAEHQARVLAALGAVSDGPRPALVICHGGSIRAAAARGDRRGLDGYHDLDVPNATVIRLDALLGHR
jgi:broad specificity phosphatase PhoE